jgi:hypothetical protein
VSRVCKRATAVSFVLENEMIAIADGSKRDIRVRL